MVIDCGYGRDTAKILSESLGSSGRQALAGDCPAPDHDMAALMFFCEEAALLISGDAFYQTALKFCRPEPTRPCAWRRHARPTSALRVLRCAWSSRVRSSAPRRWLFYDGCFQTGGA